MAEPPTTPMVSVESLRDHTNDDGTWHVAGTSYEVPETQLDSLRAQLMAVTPERAAEYRAQLQANEDWYANQGAGAVAPVLTSLVPASATLGDPSFTLHVHGTGFSAGAAILWNGTAEPTIVVSDTEVTTAVNMATAIVAAAIPVTVRTATGAVSNALTFDLQPAARRR